MSRRILILFVVVGGLAALLFLWDKPRESRQKAREARQLALSPLPVAEVDSLILQRPANRVVLVRRDDGWWLESPVREKATDAVVDDGLGFLAATNALRVVAADVDTLALDAFGLGGLRPASSWIETVDGTGRRNRVYIGRSNPTATAVYLREAGQDKVVLADSAFLSLVEGPYHAYRNYDLFNVGMEDIVELSVSSDAANWSARRDDHGLWWTTESPPRQIKRYRVRPMLYDLSTARIRRYVEDDVEQEAFAGYGLHAPILDLRLSAPQLEGRLRVGNEDEDLIHFARRDEARTVITTSAQVLANTEIPLEDLLERNPVPYNYDALDSLSVLWHTGERITAVRVGDEWAVRRPAGYSGELGQFYVSLQNVLSGVESLESTEAVELPDGNDGSEYLTIRKIAYVLYWPDRTVEIALGWRRGEDAHWVRVAGDDRVHRIERDLYFRLRGMLLVGELIGPGS